MTPKQSYT